MKNDIIFGIFLFLCIVSVFPWFLDPYFHKQRVDFWVWLKREINELFTGERE